MTARRYGLFGRESAAALGSALSIWLAHTGCGEVQSLGENPGGAGPASGGATSSSQGGAAGSSSGGTAEGGAAGGGAGEGGAAGGGAGEGGAAGGGVGEGGAAGGGAGGSSAGDNGAGGQGTGGQGRGGQGSGGRSPTANGGSGTAGAPPGAPYPLSPSVPIDEHCQCADESKVCNAASKCVPRCDTEGTCALWLIPREAQDLFAEGSALYLLESIRFDILNNPLGLPQRLLRADLATNTPPTPLAELPASKDRVGTILGRNAGSTYVEADGIFRVSDAGDVTPVLAPADYFFAVLGSDSLFYTASDGIWQQRLTAGAAPTLVVQSSQLEDISYTSLFAGDSLWIMNGDAACKVNLGTLPATLDCDPSLLLLPFASRAPNGFFTDLYQRMILRQEPGERAFYLFDAGARFLLVDPPALFGDSIYVPFHGSVPRFFKVSAQSAIEPVDVLAPAVARVMLTPQPALGYKICHLRYVVSSAGLFWTQQFLVDAPRNFSRYVFHKAL